MKPVCVSFPATTQGAILTSATIVQHETPLFGAVTFHHIGLGITAVFALIATIIALSLMLMHATHYSVPHQQKHIIRILFMIPVYSCISLVSYVYYKHAIYWEVLRDCYEAFAIASFFTLMCHYLEKDLHEQKERFRGMGVNGQRGVKNWIWPLSWFQKCTGGRDKGIFRVPRSGLTWFNVSTFSCILGCGLRWRSRYVGRNWDGKTPVFRSWQF
jgi:ABC-type sugar transport system permease subunit